MTGIEEVEKLIDRLPDALAKIVKEIVKGYKLVKPFMGFIPESGRGIIANNFGHQFVAGLKLVKWDTAWLRTLAKDTLIGLFDLDEEWLPKWPLKPPE